ncbi:putative enoyl-CoA hydratase/isomerase [Mycolicibacterium chitae]|uniref:Enoyl-CoA hydratase/carnithine racemase n=1 Tax=Mycolicibacterium chitae TaxID=1792 RepID=A0A3S4T2G2_MYCCI|nr:enoyl-CoA hydratase-related protein [Mycolicibacterium chitae]MCV7105042.1 enoyl-CoA hydratase/isomerase family protein [Mycolicibacterium chitae]BBZ05678.1 putative enoyl-CoA hydratase/isomerase [Mycolicibacterium chitae]VEG49289.1 enoyl-CoA hydratase/carnithine racemase [Mycolicibacterium chitae]
MPSIEVEEPRPGILVLRLNRPEALNAMNAEVIDELHDVLRGIRDDARIRAVVLTGAGRVFCAGLDLRGYGTPQGVPEGSEGRIQASLRVQKHIAELSEALRRVRAPIIAAVNGAAAGGGMALALLCDIRIAGSSTVFHPSFVKRGLSNCDIGVSWLLPRMIGFSRAADLLLTAKSVDAEEAEQIGIVSAVVPDDKLLETALDRGSAIAENSPFGVWMTKEVLWANLETTSLRGGVELENRTQILAASTKDHREAVAAFLEKRPAEYQNR